ncbi:MAG: glycosyltransferase family 4 protein [Cycloclasticus pugetii]|uniref:glycosyltransferase family 4 protein n=1 Tax=Cycloclasticus pugetii TaxID=34068 RepID=UPI000376BDE6|nr:glycosyltransferase family 4 protein [Cycloclasticus pugetii]
MIKILSPIARGNGAYIVHKNIEDHVSGYKVLSYSPWITLFPPSVFPIGRNLKNNIIHTSPDYACFNKKKGVPLILTFHNYVLDKYMRPYSSFSQNIHYQANLKWFTKRSVRYADEITAVSKFTALLVQQELGIEKNIRVIYNGVDERKFRPVKGAQHRSESIKVLFSGNLTTRKGAQWLLPILERLNPNVEIMYTSGLRGLGALSNHPRFVNVGKVPYEGMPHLYQSADLLLFPTVREGLPLAVLEAMSCGLPVVATNCSSLPELIDEGKGGFLCSLGDTDEFAEKINLLAETEDLRKEMGGYNRVKIERSFTQGQMVLKYQQLFDEVAQRSHSL